MKRGTRLTALAACAAATAATLTVGVPASAASDEPALKYRSTKTSVTLARSASTGKVRLAVPVHIVAGQKPFEVWLNKKSQRSPITAVRRGGGVEQPLPDGMIKDFRGLPDFTYLRVTDAKGKAVVSRYASFCPNDFAPARTTPDAPDRSPYPESCPGGLFTLGAVYGLQAGWSVPWGSTPSVKLAQGKYTLTMTVAQRWREVLGLSADDARVTVKLTVRNGRDSGPPDPHGVQARAAVSAEPSAQRPSGKASVPEGPKPNLRSLPAWGIGIDKSSSGKRQYLRFAANVWNAGPSPLVVDGFRRTDDALMDAYQYFYDEDGNQAGHAPAGTMEWDPREAHHHWHFTDFAQYRLLDKDKNVAVRSKKEAFCLANTDAVDYTVPNANWHPFNTDLHTSCGEEDSLSVREVLDVGSGDTYHQSIPGQSFDITSLKNGTYYVEVRANPNGVLHETSTEDNVSYRRLVLSGNSSHRKVWVPPYDGD